MKIGGGKMKKLLAILCLAAGLTACGAKNTWDGKISDEYQVKDPNQGDWGVVIFEGTTSVLLEYTGDFEDHFLRLGKDSPLPDCVIRFSGIRKEYPDASSNLVEYSGKNLDKSHTNEELISKAEKGCRGIINKGEAPVNVKINSASLRVSDTGYFDIEINYQPDSGDKDDYKKDRWFRLRGEKSWF